MLPKQRCLLHVCASDSHPDHLLLLLIALQGFGVHGSSSNTATQNSSNDTAVQGLMSVLQRLEAKVDLLADSMRTGLQEVNERLARLEASLAAYAQQ